MRNYFKFLCETPFMLFLIHLQNCSAFKYKSITKKSSDMAKKKTTTNSLGVDKSLVAMFLKMSPEERLQANDNAARTIQELRDAYKQQRNDRSGPKRNT